MGRLNRWLLEVATVLIIGKPNDWTTNATRDQMEQVEKHEIMVLSIRIFDDSMPLKDFVMSALTDGLSEICGLKLTEEETFSLNHQNGIPGSANSHTNFQATSFNSRSYYGFGVCRSEGSILSSKNGAEKWNKTK